MNNNVKILKPDLNISNNLILENVQNNNRNLHSNSELEFDFAMCHGPYCFC